MKKTATLLSLFFSLHFLNAQIAPDFTIVTTDGITRNLYNALDSGKTVVLDFFFTTCQGCFYYAPVIEQCYQSDGAGTGNILYWGINGAIGENDVQIDAYRTQYGITNPTASGLQGNGLYVDSLYQATFGGGATPYPIYVVVCPNRHVYWSVNYPPVVNGFTPYIVDSCSVASSIASYENPSPAVQIFPNPVNASSVIHFENAADVVAATIFSVDGKKVLSFPQPAATLPLDRQKLSPGIYFCTVAWNDGRRQQLKFVVN